MATTGDWKGVGVDAMLALVDSVSMHTADPGADGSNEVSGGSYSRRPYEFDLAVDGVGESGVIATFSIPAGTTVAYVGFWADGSTPSPEFLGGGLLVDLLGDPAPETFTADGTYVLTSSTFTMEDV